MKERIKEKINRLNSETQQIYGLIEGLSEAQLNDQSYGWSLIQVLSHLNKSETLSLVYMKKKMQAGEKMKEASKLNSFRMWLTNQALKSKLKWSAPAYIRNPDNETLDSVKTKWGETRQRISKYVEEFPEEWLNKLVYKHPMGGRQNLENAVDSFIYHQIHHLHQINRIKKKIGV